MALYGYSFVTENMMTSLKTYNTQKNGYSLVTEHTDVREWLQLCYREHDNVSKDSQYTRENRLSLVTECIMTSVKTCLLVGCLTSQQHANVSEGRICSDNCTCCHTEVADQTFHLTQSQYTDTRPTIPSADPITPGAWQGSHWSAAGVTGMTRPRKNPSASRIRTWDLPLSRPTPCH